MAYCVVTLLGRHCGAQVPSYSRLSVSSGMLSSWSEASSTLALVGLIVSYLIHMSSLSPFSFLVVRKQDQRSSPEARVQAALSADSLVSLVQRCPVVSQGGAALFLVGCLGCSLLVWLLLISCSIFSCWHSRYFCGCHFLFWLHFSEDFPITIYQFSHLVFYKARWSLFWVVLAKDILWAPRILKYWCPQL